jgi:hypothetical protein
MIDEGKGKIHPRTGHEGPEGEYTYSSILSLTLALGGVGGQCHALAALLAGKRSATCCTGGWVGPRASLDGCGKSPPTRIQSLDHPASSELLYQLCYPGPWIIDIQNEKIKSRK